MIWSSFSYVRRSVLNISAATGLWVACLIQPLMAADHAVVLVYHHVAEAAPASTSVSPEQFTAHLDYLQQHNYQVWPLKKLVDELAAARPVPEKTVAITFDDAYLSVYHTAFPMLTKRRWPFTVFVNTAAIERGAAPYMDWQKLKLLHTAGVEIGNHSHEHAHLVHRPADETQAAWQTRVRDDIITAQNQLQQHLGSKASLFAYPYGEFTPALAKVVADLGLIGFGQHSGAIGSQSNFLALPRFPVAGRYADRQQFMQRLRTAPLHIDAQPPNGHLLQDANLRPTLALRLNTTDDPKQPRSAAEVTCYASGQGLMDKQLHAGEINRFSIQPRQPLTIGRTKFNCTTANPLLPGHYLWWSYLVMRPDKNGNWYTW